MEILKGRENPHTLEARAVEAFSHFCDRAIGRVKVELERRFGVMGQDLEYHKRMHTETAAEHYESYAQICKKYGLISEEELLAGKLAVWFHDSVMDSELVDEASKQPWEQLGQRRRDTGGNEDRSFKKLSEALELFRLSEMRDHPDDSEYIEAVDALIKRTRILAKECIDATKPAFEKETLSQADLKAPESVVPEHLRERLFHHLCKADPPGKAEYLKVSQPNLGPSSTVTAFNVALADLGQVGRVSAEDFEKSGDSEMWELHAFIRHAFENFQSQTDPNELSRVAAQVINWLDVQPGFVYWQWQQAANYLRGNAKTFGSRLDDLGQLHEVINDFRALMPNFEENLINVINRADLTKKQYGDLAESHAFEGDALARNKIRLYRLLESVNPRR